MDPAVFFTFDEFQTYKKLKKEIADFSWHLQVRCEEEAEALATTRSAEALKLLMISAVESEDIVDFFTRCYALAIEQAKRCQTKIIDPFGRDCSARQHVTKNPHLLEEEKKRFPGGKFMPGPYVREGSTPPPTPGASSMEPPREAQRAESEPDDASSRGRGVERPRSTEPRPRDPSSENRGPETIPKATPKGPPPKMGPTMSPEEQQRRGAAPPPKESVPKATPKPPPVTASKPPPAAQMKPPPTPKPPPVKATSQRASSRGKTPLPEDKWDGSQIMYASMYKDIAIDEQTEFRFDLLPSTAIKFKKDKYAYYGEIQPNVSSPEVRSFHTNQLRVHELNRARLRCGEHCEKINDTSTPTALGYVSFT
eukprot:2500747-Amphidinium_carterae.2